MLLALLFPQLAGLQVHRIEDTGDAVVISASCTASLGALPGLRIRVREGARRVLADGGRRRGRRPARPDQLAGP